MTASATGAARRPLAARLAQVVATQTSIARAGLEAPAVLRLVAATAKELCPAAGAAVIERKAAGLEARAAAGTAAPLLAGVGGRLGAVAEQVLESGEPRLWGGATGSLEPAAAAVPVRTGGRVSAALVVVGDGPGAFTGEDLQVLQLLAGLAGAAISAGATPPEVRAADAERLAHLSTHDPLTMLPNRSLFGDRMRHALSLARRDRSRLCVLAVDLAGFGPINERLGAAAGDEVLREVARRLRLAAREPDTVARLGGDDFAVLLSGEATPEGARVLETRIRQALEEPVTAAGEAVRLSVRIGAAFYPHDGADADALVGRARAALRPGS